MRVDRNIGQGAPEGAPRLHRASPPRPRHVPEGERPARVEPAPGPVVTASSVRRPRWRRAEPAPGWWRTRALGTALLTIDVFAGAMTAVAVNEISPRIIALVAVAVPLFAVGGLYRARLSLSALQEVPSIVGRSLVAGALVTAVGVFDNGSAGRVTLVAAGVFGLFVCLGRAVGYALLRAGRRSGLLSHRTLIVGAGEIGGQLARTLLDHPEVGLRPVGFLDSDPLLEPSRRPLPLLGGLENLVDVIIDQQIGNVVIAFGSQRESNMVDIVRACDRMDCEIFWIPRLFELHATSGDMDMVRGVPLVRMRRATFRAPAWRLKRVFDVVMSAIALVVLAPAIAVLALVVRLRVSPSVLFRQERVGLDGRPFTLLKFCSMQPADGAEANQLWSVSQDDRVGRVGRLLRRTSLDELPQLWNVLRGDMSLVGPRPERPYFVKQFTRQFPRYMARHRVPAGLTGLAQVHGLRGDTSIADRSRFDNHYIENWSLWLDCQLLLRTVGQVIRAAGR